MTDPTHKAGAQIGRRAFLQSAGVLLLLMLAAGLLTRFVPAGSYQRVQVDGRLSIAPGSFQFIDPPQYPAWRWLTAPFEVLATPDGLTVIVIILFMLLVGATFAVLEGSGILRASLDLLVVRFKDQKYRLLSLVTLFFMAMGALFGVFEEVVPLAPIMVALALSLGWDSLVGLGMSVLATNMGFSAAIANPFTIGVAQQLAGLPLFSGIFLRMLIFVVMYGWLMWFLLRYARRVEAEPASSLVHELDQGLKDKIGFGAVGGQVDRRTRWGMRWFGGSVIVILAVLVADPFIPALSGVLLVVVGALFLIGGLGAGALAGAGSRQIGRAAWQGITGILLGVPLILMAVSIKHIVEQGMILDTILYSVSQPLMQLGPITAVMVIFLITLLLEFFVASGSAKAFLLMPLLVPLADLVGITRQTTVLSYAFGDGFSNMVYPTNPVLLITLSLTTISLPVWLRWTWKLWLGVLLLALGFLSLAVLIGYGPA